MSLLRSGDAGSSGWGDPQRIGGLAAEHSYMKEAISHEQQLELELLRRSVDALAACSERCAHCRRTPLIGERVYVYESGTVRCELCRALHRDRPVASRLVHGPEFGHTMRITDRRAAA